MIALLQKLPSVDDSFCLEAASSIEHEYIDGQIYAKTGASDSHVTIVGNLITLLRPHIRGTGNRRYMFDMKAWVESGNCVFYPDVMVTCDPRDQETSMFKRFPKLAVEVLSKSSEAYDRGDNFLAYQELESLQEYVVINTRYQRLRILRRDDSGRRIFSSTQQKMRFLT